MEKALIIGGAGFVGSYLIKHLRDVEGYHVSATKMAHEKIVDTDIGVYDLDILDKEAVEKLLAVIRPDYIFHLAAQSSVYVSWKNPGMTVDVNIKGSLNLMDAIRGLDYKPRVLLIGSGEEYGHIQPDELPLVETNHVRPGNIYAATKVCQNLIGKIYVDAYGMQMMSVRAFNHVGPNQLPMFVVADFCKQVAEIEAGQKDSVIRVGNLSAKRDFTDVRDVVRAYSMLIKKGCPGETYNVGSGQAVAIQDILNSILAMAETEISVETDPNKFRPVDVPVIEADISKLVLCTGWEREIPLEVTLRETLDYWRDQMKKNKSC